jgi:eukaryotic-like serine/threonine-protein kinase
VKVLDFGLAKPVSAEVELTDTGAVVGTPAYMSPEQARGEPVDARTDLFSLGAVLYRLCTGRLPFPGPNTMAVLTALATKNPTPVRELNPEVPEPLAALIH